MPAFTLGVRNKADLPFWAQRYAVADGYRPLHPQMPLNLRSAEVAEMLHSIALRRSLPQLLKTDNGCEFTSKMLDRWVDERGIRLNFSHRGTPTGNATVESFNGRLRQECLNENGVMSLEDARSKIKS